MITRYGRRTNARRFGRAGGFTLVEIMMVVGLIAIMFTVAIPAFTRDYNRRPMKVATEQLIELLNTVRREAIMNGVTAELRVDPQNYTFDVVSNGALTKSPGMRGRLTAGLFHVKLPEAIGIELLAVNFELLKDADSAVARFFSNGTCEEFTVVIRSLEGEYRKISVDPITSRADYEVIR